MFGLGKPKLPISEESRLWMDDCFRRLGKLLGVERMLHAVVMLPVPEHFPDVYDGSEESLRRMFCRVAEWMQVDPESVEVQLFSDAGVTTSTLLPFGEMQGASPGGLYRHAPGSKTQIEIHDKQMKDPMALVATLAHELGHVILLRPGLVDREARDMEPMNDVLMVFLGLGVFNANTAFQFKQFTNNYTQGWSASRLGYLPEELFGYALARFAFERGEVEPEWAKYLAKNIRVYFKRSGEWLKENGRSVLGE